MSSVLNKIIVAGLLSSIIKPQMPQASSVGHNPSTFDVKVVAPVYGLMCLYDFFHACKGDIKTIQLLKDGQRQQKEFRVYELDIVKYATHCLAAVQVMFGDVSALFVPVALEEFADAINWHPCVTYAYEINS